MMKYSEQIKHPSNIAHVQELSVCSSKATTKKKKKLFFSCVNPMLYLAMYFLDHTTYSPAGMCQCQQHVVLKEKTFHFALMKLFINND